MTEILSQSGAALQPPGAAPDPAAIHEGEDAPARIFPLVADMIGRTRVEFGTHLTGQFVVPRC